MTAERDEEFKDTNYELFILALSILSLVNWAFYFFLSDQQVIDVVRAVDLLLSLIFLADFLYRLFTAESKTNYFIRQYGWLDLLSGLPFPQAKIARAGRTVRAIRLMRRYGLRRMVYDFAHNQAGSAIYTISLMIILMLEFGSISVLMAEMGAPGANIETAGDALWWSIVTMSTVGYGDQYPVTTLGRLFANFVIVVGVALFGVVTGFLANRFVPSKDPAVESVPQEELAPVLAQLSQLQAQHQQALNEINAKLEALTAQLQQDRS